MKIFKKNYRISASFIILMILVALVFLTGYLAFKIQNFTVQAILGSMCAGVIVAIIQFIIAWEDYKQTEMISKLKVKEILDRRNDRRFYANYILSAEENLQMMGVTALRFFQDFADTTENAPKEGSALIQVLKKSVRVRILLPKKEYLAKEKHEDFEKVKNRIAELKQEYKSIEVKYFDHIPSHSIFAIDDTCLVGPVFPHLESKNTPALWLMKSSPIAKHYLNYFEKEWNTAANE